ncbi:DUF3426 domain-containing protein [Acinetobacter gerneri]|uniref:DUF3426 domain-containing protein n=1 Tax=Acinetobacter gerneri TaxID=202952 RepID=UPI0028A90D97|nr:DUF3426 domain-containing protein [Acinetobacter gerneri]
MPNKQTRCPNCQTIYKVSVPQLTVAQGMVCCAKCDFTFNALSNIVKIQNPDLIVLDEPVKKVTNDFFVEPSSEAHQSTQDIFKVLEIFNHKVENSNIDLLTYLNNLNYFSHEPINANPSLNLYSNAHQLNKDRYRPTFKYYLFWGGINFILCLVFLFQYIWHNPYLLKEHPFLNNGFNRLNSSLGIETLEQRYQQISASQIIVDYPNDAMVEFSGVLNNSYDKSLKMPLLQLNLLSDGEIISTAIIPPSQYLITSLQGIERIPSDSPFYFQFTVIKPKKQFDNYQIAAIEP